MRTGRHRRYIADFAAPSARVDGGYHANRARADARRDRDLGRLGWRVLRLKAALVLQSTEKTVELVRRALGA